MTTDLDRVAEAPAPVVSVIIPTYNSAATVERAVRSARTQGVVRTEVIIVDDCSTDDTVEVVRRLNWPEVRLVQRSVNGRAGAARNDALREARGEFVAFLDADDEWLPGKLARQLETFQRHEHTTLVATDCELVYPDGPRKRFHELFPPAEGAGAWKVLLERNVVVTSSAMCRRADALRLGGFREEMTYGEDLDLWIRLAELGEVYIVSDVLVRWYSQSSGLSATQPLGDLTFVLPMITDHVRRIGPRLSREERNRILGIRRFDIAYGLYRAGNRKQAAPLFRGAFEVGWRRLSSALYLLDCYAGGILERLKRKKA